MQQTTSSITYIEAVRRAAENKSTNDIDLPQTILADDERVLDVTIGDTHADDDPVLIATDRRVVLAERPSFRHWRIRQEAPGAEIVDASYTRTLLAGRLSIHLRDGSSIDLRSRTPEHAQRFIATIHAQLGR